VTGLGIAYVTDPCRVGCDLGTGVLFDQWHLRSMGVLTPPQISAAGIVIAVVDGGVRLDHPDLAGLVTRPACAPVFGRRLDLEHGTNIAGLMTARDGDGAGLGAPVPGVRLLDVPIVEVDGSGARFATSAALAAGIRCAVDEGADVINLSMAGTCANTDAVAAELARAEAAGVVVVAAAGNVDLATAPCPAAFSTVIAVAASASDGRVVSGERWGDIVAPGFELVTSSDSSARPLTVVSGTSMAAPLVSVGIAALVARYPDWAPEQIRTRVLAAASELGAFNITALLRDDLLAAVAVTVDGRLMGVGDVVVDGAAPTTSAVDLAVLECGGVFVAGTDGGVFALDGSRFRGSLGNIALAAPVVAIAATPSGNGYWMAAADGGVFAFGDAGFLGSLGGISLGSPIVDMAATSSGLGYWMIGADGQVYAFGDARHFGSIRDPARSVIAISALDAGYVLTRSDGRSIAFGSQSRSWAPNFAGTAVDAFISSQGPVLVTSRGDLTISSDGRNLFQASTLVAAGPADSQGRCSVADQPGADQ